MRLFAMLVALFSSAAAADPISDLDAWLGEHRPDYYVGLNPGVDDATLDAFEIQFGVVLPEGFRRLYRWRNGHGEYIAPSLILNLMFPPLESIADTKEFLDEMIGYDFPESGFWERNWVPFLDNGGGDYLALISDGTPQGGAVVMFYHDDPYRGERAQSFAEWLAGLRPALEEAVMP